VPSQMFKPFTGAGRPLEESAADFERGLTVEKQPSRASLRTIGRRPASARLCQAGCKWRPCNLPSRTRAEGGKGSEALKVRRAVVASCRSSVRQTASLRIPDCSFAGAAMVRGVRPYPPWDCGA